MNASQELKVIYSVKDIYNISFQTSETEDTIVVNECEGGVEIKFHLEKAPAESCSADNTCTVKLSFELTDDKGPT